MSFLSRKNSRPDRRGGRADAGPRADSEYDDYGYAADEYQDDDSWSPDEYFSPEGIKGRWAAGTRPGERPGGRGRRAAGRGHDEPADRYDDSRYDDQGSGPQRTRGPAGGYRDSYQPDSYQRDAYGQDDGYGSDDYGTGAYDLTEEADGERAERGGGRRRRDRGERGERRLRLGRRDRDPDIWPDDGVSDEDYWASVAADRPFTAADGDPLQAAADNRPMARPAGAPRPGGESRLTADRPLGTDRPLAGDPRLTSEPRHASEPRTGSGRLGPAPGLSPAASSGQSGYLSASTPPGMQGRPVPGGPSSGPMARQATGPNAVRPGTGPSPARPAAGLAQPSFQPNTRAASRQPERPDWTDRTERMDRVPPAGYPDPRMNGRSQDGRGQDGRIQDARGQGRARWGGADDDPLTSTAYSRSALTDTDGRSYRAAHRAPVPADRREAALTEQTQTFSTPGQYQADPQAATANYPAYGSQQPGQHPYDRGNSASYPYPGQQPYQSRPAPDADDERYRHARPTGQGNAGYGNYGNGGYPGRR